MDGSQQIHQSNNGLSLEKTPRHATSKKTLHAKKSQQLLGSLLLFSIFIASTNLWLGTTNLSTSFFQESSYINHYKGPKRSSKMESQIPRIIPTKKLDIDSKTLVNGVASHHHHFQQHDISPKCRKDASSAILGQWKNSSRIVCALPKDPVGNAHNIQKNDRQGDDDILIQEFSLTSWEYEPTVLRFQNVETMSWGGDILPTDCPENTVVKTQKKKDINFVTPPWATSEKTPEKTSERIEKDGVSTILEPVLQIAIFGTNNAYERFHAYLNTAMVMAMFDIENPRLVLIMKEGVSMNQGDLDMWKSFSDLDPVVVDDAVRSELNSTIATNPRIRLHFRDLIHVSGSGTSILVTKSEAFLGRGKDHHCKSSLFRDIIHWMTLNHGIDIDENRGKRKNVTHITWSSRSSYCCREGKTYHPKRGMENEEELLRKLGELLGPTYSISIVDFGKISTRESIEIASSTDIMVGAHGAGLMWSAFLPHHGGLVEIFGGNRARGNRHYHNIASLADLHYRELPALSGMNSKTASLHWNADFLQKLVKEIQSINPGNTGLEP